MLTQPRLKDTTKYQIAGQAVATVALILSAFNFSMSTNVTRLALSAYITGTGGNLSFAAIRENKNKLAFLGLALVMFGTTLLHCSFHDNMPDLAALTNRFG